MQYHFTSVQRLIQIRCLFGFYFWRGFGRGVKSQEEMLLCCWRNKMKLDSATFSVCGKFEGLGGGGVDSRVGRWQRGPTRKGCTQRGLKLTESLLQRSRWDVRLEAEALRLWWTLRQDYDALGSSLPDPRGFRKSSSSMMCVHIVSLENNMSV